MKASELRIGNLILAEFGFGYEQIETVDVETFNRLESDHVTFSGIQLTEEWLLRFGFVIDSDEFVYILHDTIEITKTDYGNTFYFMGNFIKSDIKHVHQLQNLYYDLTGEELEIINP